MTDLIERLAILRQKTDGLRLYVLLDGAQYLQHRGERMTEAEGRYALFAGTPDAPLSHVGPWLIDAETIGESSLHDLIAMEREIPALTWIIAPQTLDGLAQLLQLNLNLRLPDGRTALLRFWDPRVLVTLADVLTAEQRYAFFGRIYEWHLLHEGRRVWIGRHHA